MQTLSLSMVRRDVLVVKLGERKLYWLRKEEEFPAKEKLKGRLKSEQDESLSLPREGGETMELNEILVPTKISVLHGPSLSCVH